MTRRAFTLIEVMIAVAILAVVLATAAVPRAARAQLGSEANFRYALRSARMHLGQVAEEAFESLPPRMVRVGPQGQVDLDGRELVEGSIRVWKVEPGYPRLTPSSVEEAEGRLRLDPGLAGTRVLVDYQQLLPELMETHTVPSSPPLAVTLDNAPARRVAEVRLARGESLVPLSGWKLTTGSRLELPASAAGGVVAVRYWGDEVRLVLSGTFVDEELREVDRPSPLKRVSLSVYYGGRHQLELRRLKVQP